MSQIKWWDGDDEQVAKSDSMDCYKRAFQLVHATCQDPTCAGVEDIRHMPRAVRLVELLRDLSFVREWLDGNSTPDAEQVEQILQEVEPEPERRPRPELEQTHLDVKQEVGGHDHECSICNQRFGPCLCQFPDMPRSCAACENGWVDALVDSLGPSCGDDPPNGG